MAGVVQDVTARKAAEAALAAALRDREMLLREIHHRIKNSLQLVSSTLRLQAHRAGNMEVRLHLDEAERRVFAIAKVHDHLYRQPHLANRIEIAPYLTDLCGTLQTVTIGAGGRVALAVAADPAEVPTDQAVNLALIVTELVTNALKYAFPGGGPGTVTVTFRVEPDGHGRLTVADDGQGLPPGFDFGQGGGLGMRLVQSLVHSLEGTVAFESSPAGTRFTARLPALRAAGATEAAGDR